jgi:branched-chain amino acid transport system ATP-binding protein
MLRAEEVSVTFGGVRALDQVGLVAEAGVVTGLIGPNGAGKTTLFNVITGLQRPDQGRVVLGSDDVTSLSPKNRARRGLGRTFQRLEVFGSLSVRDNVLVSLENRRITGGKARARVVELLQLVGLADQIEVQADILPTGMARLLELARALAAEPKVLLLDEPSSGLDGEESRRLSDLVVKLASEGMAVLLVEHDMDLVMTICSRIHVLDFGRIIADGTPAEVRADPAVQAAYLGAVVA